MAKSRKQSEQTSLWPKRFFCLAGIFLLFCWPAKADSSKNIHADFFGQRLLFAPVPGSDTGVAALDDVLTQNRPPATDLAAVVRHAVRQWKLDAYGTLLLVQSVLQAVGPTVSNEIKGIYSLPAAIANQAWNMSSRNVAMVTLLRQLGYNAIPVQVDERQYIGLEVRDHTLQGNFYTLTVGARRWRYILWDGEDQIGLTSQANILASFKLATQWLFDNPPGYFDFAGRALPNFLYKHQRDVTMDWYKSGKVLSFRQFPLIADYLKILPELSFRDQLHHAVRETRPMGLATVLAPFQETSRGEVNFVNQLLHTFQNGFIYKIGPLRNVFELFRTRSGDCDEMSLLFAATLINLGYSYDHLRAIRWPEHLGLALLPKKQAPETGTFMSLDKKKYFLIDMTYYKRTPDGTLVNVWGDLAQDYDRSAEVLDLRK